jgi:Ca2+ transporting ATPase
MTNKKLYGPSRHFTLLFNVFVWMQIFNFLNARKIEDEFNIFEDITDSPMFFAIVILIIILQFLCVIIGNRPLACSPHVTFLFLPFLTFKIGIKYGSMVDLPGSRGHRSANWLLD